MTDTTKGIFIDELDARSGNVTFKAAVAAKSTREMKSGNKYFALTLKDLSGEIDARIWRPGDHDIAEVQAGQIAKVQGEVEEFPVGSGVLQLNVKRIRPCAADEYSIGDFIPASKFDPDEMYSRVWQYAGVISDDSIGAMLWRILADHRDALLRSPAAKKMHHAYVGGLLEHTLSMLGAAEQLCNHYSRLNRDLLYAGVILHDICKCQEYSVGLTFEVTTIGQLLGHIPLGVMLVEQYGESLDAATRLQIQHLIASHHGELEWGAAQEPKTPEAIALHYIDQIDAKLTMCFAAIDAAPCGAEWTEQVPGLRRQFFVAPAAAAVLDARGVEEVAHVD
jgi:3'-5' exoribonuclease